VLILGCRNIDTCYKNSGIDRKKQCHYFDDFKKKQNAMHWWQMFAILATLEGEIGRMIFWGQPGQKVHKTPSQSVAGHGGTCLSSQLCRKLRLGEYHGSKPTHAKTKNRRRITVLADLSKMWHPLFKITRAKMARVIVHALKHLSSKHKPLSSNPEYLKKKK
jgi:hypothetical protein